MNSKNNTWALVLAAGEGKRLNSLTTDSRGVAIPKQYCSLNGGSSLLEETVNRAEAVVERSRVTAVVAEQHHQFWSQMLGMLPAGNCFAQPQNRGTGIGILLPLLQIMNRDPNASLVLLPSDHYVGNEKVLRNSIRKAIKQVRSHAAEIVLLGIKPDQVDPELGYILPGRIDDSGAYSVLRFIEKPPVEQAARLLNIGAVWNSFIIVASGQSLLDLYVTRFPEVVQAMICALTGEATQRAQRLRDLYAQLPDIDFSRHIVSGAEEQLSVLPVPRCGWSDLGTPRRVGEAIARLEKHVRTLRTPAVPYFNLAAAHSEMMRAG